MGFLDTDLDFAVFDKLLAIDIDSDISGLGQDIYGHSLFAIEDAFRRFIGASDREMHLISSCSFKGGIDDRTYADGGIIAIDIPVVPIVILGWDSIIGRINARPCIERHRQRSRS